MKIVRSKKELLEVLAEIEIGKTICFVPTMGALHEGHLSLVDIAKAKADIAIASIFVNSAQFAPHEDFDKYPRDEAADLKMLESRGADIVYLPRQEEMYPQGFDIKISTGDIGQQLEGITRPHFFDGIALVITKFFNQIKPDMAIFGEKDYQQLHVIRKLVDALDMDVTIIGGPIVREANGLAMSSRNRYLSDVQKEQSAALNKSLLQIKDSIIAGAAFDKAISSAKQYMLAQGFDSVDYIEIRHSQTLAPARDDDDINSLRIIATAYLNGVRLLDNIGF